MIRILCVCIFALTALLFWRAGIPMTPKAPVRAVKLTEFEAKRINELLDAIEKDPDNATLYRPLAEMYTISLNNRGILPDEFVHELQRPW